MSETLELLLDRRWKKEEYTIGEFFVDCNYVNGECVAGKYFSNTCEDKDRGLSSDMPVNKIKRLKIPGKTAIPTGRYRIDMHTVSPRFRYRYWAKKYNGCVPRLLGVPCYSGVLLHPFNFADQSEGCIAHGENRVKGGVVKAVEYFEKLMDNYLVPADTAGKEIWITIR